MPIVCSATEGAPTASSRVSVTAADDWGGPAGRKRVRPALGGSAEELFHEVGLHPPGTCERRDPPPRDRAAEPLLPRARRGPVRRRHPYRHMEETRAVEPLERAARW
ncbi:erythromycin esterase family protein [Streptomyces sp. NPDC005266]|uniref:erythromycin esterase family protein n=1 Tax=Streptomyces sp. NPDC005266 TaxID=3154877 RepID=UPI0033AF6249